MANILGDSTFISLLELLKMEQERKQAIIDLLPKMGEQDRIELFESLSQLFEYQLEKKVITQKANMLSKEKNPDNIDWKKFDAVKKEALKEILSEQE